MIVVVVGAAAVAALDPLPAQLAGTPGATPAERSQVAATDRAGRLRARPVARIDQAPGVPGLHRLRPAGTKGGLLYVPPQVRTERGLPLIVTLHGAGSRATAGMRPFRALARRHALLVLAPESEGPVWDATARGFGADVATIDGLMAHTFARYPVDRSRIALLGFSNGGAYALSLGPTNGDLFTHLVALAPGTPSPGRRRGRPPIFVAQGRDDSIVPARHTRGVVARLRRAGYRVRYRELAGGHEVRPEVAEAVVRWVLVG